MAGNGNFWNKATLEPKRKFRWLLYWTGVPQFIIKSVKKPSYSVATTQHQYLNYEFYYPGRVTWQDITITLVDPVQPDSTASLYRMLENSGYVIPSKYEQGIARTVSKSQMVSALGNEIALVQLDSGGTNEIEKWIIKNPLITSVDFDTVDYSSDEMLNISVTIKYDYAYLENLGTLTAGDSRTNAPANAGGPELWSPITDARSGNERSDDNSAVDD